MKKLQNKVDVTAPGGANDYGQIKDDTGANDGTPIDLDLLTDGAVFLERLIDKSGIIANGLRDDNVNGYQIYEAFRKLARPYNAYSALISQTGGGIPTAIVLENSTGVANPTFTKVGTGIYNIVFPSAVLTSNKTSALVGPFTAVQRSAAYSVSSTTTIQLFTGNSGTLADGLLVKTFIEIRIFD